MSYSPRIKAIKPRDPKAFKDPKAGRLEVDVELENGPPACILVRTPASMAKDCSEDSPFAFGRPVLFVAKIDEASVGEAVSAMAQELSGYWLRYYDR